MKTWTHPENDVMWLRDLLPKSVPHSRIMTFGYDVKIHRSQIIARLEDHAKCLLQELSMLRENGAPNVRPSTVACAAADF